jgi:peptidoglycan/LPS O-acetylase OafA/YrhL
MSVFPDLRRLITLPPAALLAAVLLTGLAWLVYRLVERPLAPRLWRPLSRPVKGQPQPTDADADGAEDLASATPRPAVPARRATAELTVPEARSLLAEG